VTGEGASAARRAEDLLRFEHLSYDEFRRLATDERLSRYERIGFPNEYRQGKEEAIFADIAAKLPQLAAEQKLVVDIGPGCSDLPRMLIELCGSHGHSLLLVDSPEMLAQLPDEAWVTKHVGRFPSEVALAELRGRADVVIAYSLLHYVFEEGNVWAFLDDALALLAPGGTLLLGDIPNVSKRKRFFASERGRAFHREFMQTDEPPELHYNVLEEQRIDDAVVFGLLARARAAGFDAYVAPQRDDLPMANRREDIVIVRP
jgi:SAM-dependent methyltransferase